MVEDSNSGHTFFVSVANQGKNMSSEHKRILVVDDDELLRRFYCRVLSSQGYIAVSAGDGAEAIEILDTEIEPFDLAVVDLLLPVRTGWELIDYVRNSERLKELPILAITGLSFSYEEFSKIKTACDAVLLKGDFEISKFNETVHELLGEEHEED